MDKYYTMLDLQVSINWFGDLAYLVTNSDNDYLDLAMLPLFSMAMKEYG